MGFGKAEADREIASPGFDRKKQLEVRMGRTHRSPYSFVAGSLAVALLLLAGFSRAAFALPRFSDNFSENTQSIYWYNFPMDSGAEALADTGGLLQFTATSAANGKGNDWVLSGGIDTTQNFSVKATWHFAQSLPEGSASS